MIKRYGKDIVMTEFLKKLLKINKISRKLSSFENLEGYNKYKEQLSTFSMIPITGEIKFDTFSSSG